MSMKLEASKRLANNHEVVGEGFKSRILIATVKSVLLAWCFLVLLDMGCASAESYWNALVEGVFQDVQVGVLDDADREWIQNRGYVLKDPKAVTVFSMQLPAQDSICAVGLEVQFFEDPECKGKFCRMVIKCGALTAPGRLNLRLMARKDIAIASWSSAPRKFDVCMRQTIRALTPFGPLLVVIGKYGFEIADPNSRPSGCGGGRSF